MRFNEDGGQSAALNPAHPEERGTEKEPSGVNG